MQYHRLKFQELTKRIEIEKEYLLQQAFENAELFNAKAVALAETSAMLRQQAEAEWETVTDEETGHQRRSKQ